MVYQTFLPKLPQDLDPSRVQYISNRCPQEVHGCKKKVMRDVRKKFITISGPEKTKTIQHPVQNMMGALPWDPPHERSAGGV